MLEENAEAVARVSKTFGQNGELTLNLYDSFPQDFNPSEPLFVVIDKLAVPLFCDRFQRRGRSGAVVAFGDIDTERRAAELIGLELYLNPGPDEEDDEGDGEDGLKAVKAHAQELACGPLRDFRVGLTYGGQPSREKTAALADFAAGRTQVLVATTVIEVGVNVPNATVMIVEDADRYGLAQLHQLRGRVGRGSGQSWCFLMARPNDRLRALAATNDGFEVARADLEQRGPGELLGARQHGAAASLAVGNSQLLYEAARCAEELWTLSEWAPERDAVAGQARLRLQQLEERVSIS